MNISEKRKAEIKVIRDKDIDTSDIPELGDEFWAEAKLKEPKKAISLRVDADILAWFKQQGRGYQSRINAVLRSYMEARRGR